jgi:glycosyltransferase involved in cell wall biosynthesis
VKVLLFANTDWYLYNYRLAFAQELRKRGHQVILVSPDGSYASRLQEQGFRWVCFPFSRKGLNPLVETWVVLRLIGLYRREKPDLVHHFTIKCVLYGSLAARWLGMRAVINSVTGLGYAFTERANNRTWMKSLIKQLYRIVLRRAWVIFQNPKDREVFLSNHLVDLGHVALVRGSGTNIENFSPSPEVKGTPIVILPARLLWDKGVAEFVAAAKILHEQGVKARFALVGDTDEGNPSAVPADQLCQWAESGLVEWWGWRDDMVRVYSVAHVICLPTFYPEGVPKSLVEGAACGRPLVASQIPGCREVITDGENGFLVPPHDEKALAAALLKLIRSPSLRRKMGTRGRERVIREFSSEVINAQTLDVYRAVLGEAWVI